MRHTPACPLPPPLSSLCMQLAPQLTAVQPDYSWFQIRLEQVGAGGGDVGGGLVVGGHDAGEHLMGGTRWVGGGGVENTMRLKKT